MTELIPYMVSESGCTEIPWTFPIPDLISEIVARTNMEESFDYVVSHLENADQREHMKPKRKQYVDRLIEEISNGTFRITERDFRTLKVTDGPKDRIVQCPTVYHRVGCHAIMVIFEKYTYPTLITNTGASIKGRGMHWLFHIIEEDMAQMPEWMKFYYQSDICHYYDNIDQRLMKADIRKYTSDPILLPLLDNFVELLPEGLSKGLRSSQCFANLHLSDIDHKMCARVRNYIISVDGKPESVAVAKGMGEMTIKGQKVRFLYYRYCDDIVIFAPTKKELWLLRDYLVALLAEKRLSVKPSEAVRPLKVGCDFLGFKNFGTHALIRKRTKQKFARGLARVKSRKRRQKLIGSFFGMASHADCKHLLKTLISPSEYKRLKHKRKMNEFGNFNLTPTTLDGKKNFRGNKISPRELDGKGFVVVDFERDVASRRDKDDYQRRLQDASARGINPDLVEKPKTKYILQIIYNGAPRKLWTGDRDIWNMLEQIEAMNGRPFFVAIEMDYTGQYPKANFEPASKFGLTPPSDTELEALIKRFNLEHFLKPHNPQ